MATSTVGSWLLVAAWALVVYVLLTQPDLFDEPGLRRLRLSPSSVGHAVFFAALGFLVTNAMARHQFRQQIWWTVVILTVYGIIGELLQATVPGRAASIVDVAADAIGAFAGAVACIVLARWHSGTDFRRAARLWSLRARGTARSATTDHGVLAPAERQWHE
jgi:VanZ family protein